jgi:ERCC4-type nuclease
LAEKFADLSLVSLKICRLKTGDICLDDICFERKTIGDFVGSILGGEKGDSGRIFSQSERMINGFRKHYVFVTQTLDDYKGNVHRHCILGAMARLLVEGMTICFGISNEEDFVYLVLKTLEKEGKLKIVVPRKSSVKKGIVSGQAVGDVKKEIEIESVFFE